MKRKTKENAHQTAVPSKWWPATLSALAVVPALVTVSATALADGTDDDASDKANQYHQVNLVSDQVGKAMLQDTNLVNAWGLSFSPTSPFWISDNGSALATLYSVTNDSSGHVQVNKVGLQVRIPGEGTPTGQLFNGTGGFNGDIFIFASEDGTISGWRPALGTTAETLTNRSTAVYKGITLVTTTNGPLLLAANFREGSLDVYGTNSSGIQLLGQFSDPKAPAGYAPFNVRWLEGIVFVTFAKQDAAKHDNVAGPGSGLIDLFDPNTGMFQRLVTGSDAGGHFHEINSPWGLAIAPGSFGSHGDQLLVGNFGSGTIMSFEADGDFRGLLKGVNQGRIVIDGLWTLSFGGGGKAGTPDTLFFTAGPDSESHGLLGSLTPLGRAEEDGNPD